MASGRLIRVRGQVQGVGFRPFVWQLAERLRLRGEVLNDPEGVLIRVWGMGLDDFERRIAAEAPPLARVDAVESAPLDLDPPPGFSIAASTGTGGRTRVTPDAATCPECLQEIRTPGARRHGYAFANCTHCGPRFSILAGLPYDRAQTAMADFAMCPDCAAEYADPADRRFHAQPVACPACGPRLWIERGGQEIPGDAIGLAARALAEGEILAIKGLGGFHLACDATNAEAVARLRHRKHRPAKPFALMGTAQMIGRHARLSAAEQARLRDPAAPILLLRAAGAPLPEALAPGQRTLGFMLPYTPLHHLLLDAVNGPLVMTSGNLSGEPQAIGNDEAREKLAGFADAFLMHDRRILRRLDDGVERITPQGAMTLRRARGRVPGTLPLPPGFEAAPQVAALGGQMKSAICLLKDGQALLSHHLGDLDDALTWDAFLQAEADYTALLDHRPEVLAVDLHPEFRATRHGRARAMSEGLRLEEVQHHHAHMAAALGEAGWQGARAVGIVLDGLGLGSDGTVWGGEVLVGDYAGATRAAWLTPAPLIGGDRAQIEPWRNALVRLDAAGHGDLADRLFPGAPLALARQVAARGPNAPMSSSVGRLYDAVAACLGICPMRQSFEGEAAMRLEALAEGADGSAGYAFGQNGPMLDPAPVFQALAGDLAAGMDRAGIAARFQTGLARAFAGAARQAAMAAGTRTIALSGGCFQNATLLALTCAALPEFRLCLPREAPANDGGLALGQALVAAARALRLPESS
ncbi:carbamoyltransferase HypF [Tropicimonas sp. IMCC34043]|uniref:carbamoyltransferase HypF n=1 Tax=Tropicimonas sp. IMCC34043 TaxID=2248760 RepID=UPI000E2523F6|nr:carbamoyltransferase HypF [Tropicimonas sp. IMCC34043]